MEGAISMADFGLDRLEDVELDVLLATVSPAMRATLERVYSTTQECPGGFGSFVDADL